MREEDPLLRDFRAHIKALGEGDEADMIAAAYASPAVHFALYCRIRDQDNQLIDPFPNILQLRMCEAFETIKEMGIRVRIIVTKPRRAGCSSFVEQIGYHSAMKNPIKGMTIADDKEGSKAAMDKLASFEEMDSFKWDVNITANPAHSITWSNGSSWIVGTAENADEGAGDTLQFFHGTEVSKWPKTTVKNDKKVMSCVTPALSGMNTVIFNESTPEGAVGLQYETWQTAVWLEELIEMHRKGICPEEIWVKVFAAWFEFEENQRQSPVSANEIAHFKATLTDHERKEIDLYGLTWEQIGWRRDTLASKCNNDPKVFSYYFPSDDQSCWLASGAPVFDMQAVTEMERKAKGQTPDTGYLVTQQDERVIFDMMRDGTGDIEIWERPKAGLRYCLIIDPANNITQTIGANPDANSINVWRSGYHDILTNRWMVAKKVARVKAPYRADGDEVAGHAVRLSKFYGRCIVAQEVNIGLDILRLLQLARIPLYKHRPMSHRTGKIEEQIGFKMDASNREAIIQGLAAAIRNKDIEVHCLHTLAEYKTFIRKPNGRAEASLNNHDDDVMADAIAWEVMPSATEYREIQAKHQDPPDNRTWKRVSGKW